MSEPADTLQVTTLHGMEGEELMAGGDGRGRHHGAWQLLCAAPAVLASAVMVLVAFAWLGEFAVLALATWLLCAPLLLSTAAERFVVRHVYRFRRPTGVDEDWLDWLQARVERRCGLEQHRFDWYVHRDDHANAMSVGRRTIAVTSGFLQLLSTRRIGPDQGVAVAMHEVGHHATRGAHYSLLIEWLTWPWQTTYRIVMRLGAGLPFAATAKLLWPVVFAVALINIARDQAGPPEHVIPVLILLGILALAVLVYPIAASAFSRAGEHAADAYACRLGAGPDLATALSQLAPCRANRPLGWLRDTHPAPSARLQRLSAAPAVGSDSDRSV